MECAYVELVRQAKMRYGSVGLIFGAEGVLWWKDPYSIYAHDDFCNKVKRRLRALEHTPAEHVTLLLATPVLFLAQAPTLAKNVFSADHPPISCPLRSVAISHQLTLLQGIMRGHHSTTALGSAQDGQMSRALQNMHFKCSQTSVRRTAEK